MGKYQTISVGDKAELTHTITQRDVEHFVELTGDDNRLHVDKSYAETTIFKKPVAHGMLGASFISTVIGTQLPGDGALWFAQSIEFLAPVRVGDTITVQAEVLKKYDRDHIIELQTDIYNQNKQKVTVGIAKVKIIEPIAPLAVTSVPEKRKVALVVGATGGIGRAVCRQLANDGFSIAIHYHSNKQVALELKNEIESSTTAIVCCADIVDAGQVQKMMEEIARKLDGLTVVVNCATVKLAVIPFAALTWQDLQSHLDTNIKGIFHVAQSAAPLLEQHSCGKIINFTTQAIEAPTSGWLSYITAKSALHGFSKALAVELAPKGITVNMVSPGMTDTELIADIPEKARLMTAARTPLRRIAKPEDIAGAVSFLASGRSDFMTGETLRINGGQVMI